MCFYQKVMCRMSVKICSENELFVQMVVCAKQGYTLPKFALHMISLGFTVYQEKLPSGNDVIRGYDEWKEKNSGKSIDEYWQFWAKAKQTKIQAQIRDAEKLLKNSKVDSVIEQTKTFIQRRKNDQLSVKFVNQSSGRGRKAKTDAEKLAAMFSQMNEEQSAVQQVVKSEENEKLLSELKSENAPDENKVFGEVEKTTVA